MRCGSYVVDAIATNIFMNYCIKLINQNASSCGIMITRKGTGGIGYGHHSPKKGAALAVGAAAIDRATALKGADRAGDRRYRRMQLCYGVTRVKTRTVCAHQL